MWNSIVVLSLFHSLWFCSAVCRPPPGNGTFRPHGSTNQQPDGKWKIQHDETCGLSRPRKEDFTGDLEANFTTWMKENYDNYVASKYETLPLYLAGEFAPEFSRSKMACDGLEGSCSITTCKDISTNLTQKDRQMAYYAFEMLSNINHIYAIQTDAVHSSAGYMAGRYQELVQKFTAAQYMQNKATEKAKNTEILTSSINAFLLIGSSFLGFPGASAAGTAGKIGATSSVISSLPKTLQSVRTYLPSGANIFTSFFIGMNEMVKSVMTRENIHLVDDAESAYQTLWTEVVHKAESQNLQDVKKLMAGDEGVAPAKLKFLDLVRSPEFIELDSGFRELLTKIYERHFSGVAVNGLWAMERPYILDTDSENCALDKRGPPRNKVCLPKYPKRAFWLYTIDHMEKNGSWNNDQTQIRSPAGYRKMVEHPNEYYNISKEDIIESSLWVHENPDVENRTNAQEPIYDHPLLSGGNDFGIRNARTLPGVFNIAICRNPGGEAISSVWHDDARNYPCMCGEFGWGKHDGWTFQKDETQRFLEKTGLYASEDFEDFCSHHLGCKEEDDIDWDFKIGPGMPPKAKQLKHPFKMCKHPKKHSTWGSSDMDR
ncbi:hypothetical protein K491DRAFT_779790 [Lophiostoma macrostomum CBS 122681]|uniref:Uncharacterized protein n=1 Tax=Lophiostoma macrostomum CBS 122681 TaxID=1314788 RepID=A0A6A6T4E6_9PLEO|nr:hypothetical protein K491DRAFT_779790 [Lophiostoma macrostomum CBS 122681]